ncbi:MAG TPA: vanadium-dependent haloperoxidase [Candidatus Limnocylindrales bacterium]|nr:vanadium-dependent haloperoxidase [Candidatus Limnocylindrales bacterium]
MNRVVHRWRAMRHDVLGSALVIAVLAAAVATGGTGARAADSFQSPKVVMDWNINAVTALRAAVPAKSQAEGPVYMAYAQAAVYDAVTKIDGRYVPYHDFNADSEGASVEAAVVAAAYNTLVAFLGDPGLVLKGKYDVSLAALPDAGKAAGIAVGKAASDDLVAFRAGDGHSAVITTPYGQCTVGCPPGLWVFAPPPAPQAPVSPQLAFMRPFLLQSASQFRAAPPPSLTSKEYVEDLNEVRLYGAANSTLRTADQTAVAYFWLAYVAAQNNQTYRDFAVAHGMDLVDTARLLAMGNVIGSDAIISCWDSKYTYQFWRPITAMRAGSDPTWTALTATPQHPEYPSGHGCNTGAVGEVLAAAGGTRRINVDIWGAQGGANALTTTRHFNTVKDLHREMINARVWVGYHFRGSVETGLSVGQKVARWELRRYFLPVGSDESDGAQNGDNGTVD